MVQRDPYPKLPIIGASIYGAPFLAGKVFPDSHLFKKWKLYHWANV
ncbi:hypothetical protein BSM4216_2486 [Bacillus smithii]|nr:hypothetical protein BSM4216_2486 [Bacillus smithii]